MTIFEIRYEVDCAIREQVTGNRRTLWDDLVESSVKMDGAGCNGMLLTDVERHAERLLHQLSDADMRRIWLGTENGIMADEQGFSEPDRGTMVQDITIELYEAVAEEVCREAERILKKRKPGRKASSGIFSHDIDG